MYPYLGASNSLNFTKSKLKLEIRFSTGSVLVEELLRNGMVTRRIISACQPVHSKAVRRSLLVVCLWAK